VKILIAMFLENRLRCCLESLQCKMLSLSRISREVTGQTVRASVPWFFMVVGMGMRRRARIARAEAPYGAQYVVR
jgi:surface polysaccharide O-acyltransferase-like enzyme